MEKQEKPTKKFSAGLVLSWVFGVLFALIGLLSLISEPITGVVMLIMAAVLLPPAIKIIEEKFKVKIARTIKIIFIIVGLIIMGALPDTSSDSTSKVSDSQSEPQIDNQETQTEKIQGDNDVVQDNNQDETIGLSISRNQVTSVLEKPAVGFKFEEGVPVNGLENYVSNKGGAVVQLLGPSDNLTETSIIALLAGDAGENMMTLAMVIGFANVMDETSVDWISDEFKKVSKNPSKEYSNTKIFGDKLFKIEFAPSDYFNSFTLEVKTAL